MDIVGISDLIAGNRQGFVTGSAIVSEIPLELHKGTIRDFPRVFLISMSTVPTHISKNRLLRWALPSLVAVYLLGIIFSGLFLLWMFLAIVAAGVLAVMIEIVVRLCDRQRIVLLSRSRTAVLDLVIRRSTHKVELTNHGRLHGAASEAKELRDHVKSWVLTAWAGWTPVIIAQNEKLASLYLEENPELSRGRRHLGRVHLRVNLISQVPPS